MNKSADAFRSIGEVARLLGIAPHVLRYWETQFPLLKPMKRPDGRRYYRPDDVRLAAGLCTVLRDEGLTIRGARMLLARDRGATLRERGMARLADLPEPDEAAAFPNDADLPQHPAPKSRHRRRRAGDTRPPAVPEYGTRLPDWLDRLVALNAGLRDARPDDTAILRGRPVLTRLRDGLTRIC